MQLFVFISKMYWKNPNKLSGQSSTREAPTRFISGFSVETVFYRYDEVAIKQNIVSFVITWMNLDGIILNEISHREKDNYCMVHTCGLRKKTKKVKLTETEQDGGCQRLEGGKKGRGWHTVTSFQL